MKHHDDSFGSYKDKQLILDIAGDEIYLNPGEYFVGDARFKVRTLLGSCVSTVIWHAQLQHGAMSHCILSTRQVGSALQLDGSYVDEVLELMVRQLQQLGVPLHECVAKVFGGGNMFPEQQILDKLNVGKKNGEAAKALLQKYALPVVAEDLFGVGHRELTFSVKSGEVWVRHVNSC